jgi:AcrR family transcriptional regulator
MITERQGGSRAERAQATRQRLLVAAIELFAQKGFHGTTVGEIEAAAGLAPRRGALYKHFADKQALLHAALEEHVGQVAALTEAMEELPVGDVRSELSLLCRWLLDELTAQRPVTHILEKEGEQFPDLVALMCDKVVQVGYRHAAAYARRRLPEDIDADALAAIAVGSVVNYRRMQWTFGTPPLDIDQDRFVHTWVDTLARLVETANSEQHHP